MRSVLWNFLGTFTSRYSDFQGYWLFGFLIEDLVELRIDLLAPAVAEPHLPSDVAIHTAVEKFEDQLRKARLDKRRIREAWLTIRKLPERLEGTIGSCGRAGHKVAFLATAVMDNGSKYEREQFVLVAPHDPSRESRNKRADDRPASHRSAGGPRSKCRIVPPLATTRSLLQKAQGG